MLCGAGYTANRIMIFSSSWCGDNLLIWRAPLSETLPRASLHAESAAHTYLLLHFFSEVVLRLYSASWASEVHPLNCRTSRFTVFIFSFVCLFVCLLALFCYVLFFLVCLYKRWEVSSDYLVISDTHVDESPPIHYSLCTCLQIVLLVNNVELSELIRWVNSHGWH